MIFTISIGSSGSGKERYTLYFPFVLSPGRELETPLLFPLDSQTLRLEKYNYLYAISAGPFNRQENARKYVSTVRAALLWLSLTHQLGISYPKDISEITYFKEPVELSDKSNLRQIAKSVGWEYVHGHYDADKIVVVPEHEKLTRWETGKSGVMLEIGADNFTHCVRTAIEFPNLEKITELPRLQLAIELYSVFSFELSENAQFIALVTSLESLIPVENIPDHAYQSLRKAKERLIGARDRYEKDSEEWSDMNHLVSRLGGLRNKSIGVTLRGFISNVVERAPNLGDPDEVSDKFKNIYALRSRLLHKGVADQAQVNDALGFLREFVPSLLRHLFKETAIGIQIISDN